MFDLISNTIDMARTALTELAVSARGRALALKASTTDTGFEAGSIGAKLMEQQSPSKRGDKELMQAYRKSPWLRSVVGKISQHVGAVPWTLQAVKGTDGSGNAKWLRPAMIQRSGYPHRERMLQKAAERDDVVDIYEHPLLDMLATANPFMTGFDAMEVSQAHLDLKGETFWLLAMDDVLKIPVDFWPIPPTWVEETPTTAKPSYTLNMRGERFTMPADRVMWLRYRDPADPYGRGTGYAESLSDEIDTDEYSAQTVKRFFFNRARPDILVAVEGAKQAELERMKESWMSNQRGFWRAGRPHFHNGKVSVQELTKSFKEMELTNLRTWERDAFRHVFGVPPELLGLTSNSNRAAITQAMRIMAIEVIIPRLEFLRAQMQSYLVPLFDDRLILGYPSPMPDDRELELSHLQAQPRAATRGEWRKRQGLQDRGEVDNFHMMPLNEVPVEPGGEDALELGEEAEVTKARPTTNAQQPGVTKAIADRIAEAGSNPEELRRRFDPMWLENIEEWYTAEMADLGQGVGFNQFDPKAKAHLEDFSSTRIDRIAKTTQRKVGAALADGLAAGEGIPEMEKRLRALYKGFSKVDATRIARTEVMRSSNFAIMHAQETSGVVAVREWITRIDSETRTEHEEMDGQHAAIGEPFVSPSGDEAMHPGEFGDGSMDINCRCTTAAVIEDLPERGEEGRGAVWKAFDRRLVSWERQAISAARASYKDQLESALTELNALLG